jgi:hypothetical protein
MRVRPEATPSGPRFGLQALKLLVVRGIAPIPPREAGAHEFPVDVAAVGQDHVGHDAIVAVSVGRIEPHDLPEGELGSELLGLRGAGGGCEAQPEAQRRDEGQTYAPSVGY